MNWAIVTGASSGIGADFARILAKKKGLKILAIARREDRLGKLKAEIEESGGTCETLTLDLTEVSSIKALESYIKDSNLPVRWLVNNAGFGHIGEFADQPQSNIAGMLNLNITNLTLITKAMLTYMTSDGEGGNSKKAYILNVASSLGYLPSANMAVYAASKSYVLSFSVGLSEELRRHKIVVSAVCPGPVITEFMEIATGKDTSSKKSSGRESTGKLKGVAEYFFENSTETAQTAIKKCEEGKTIIFSGFMGRSLQMASSILPYTLLAKMTKNMPEM